MILVFRLLKRAPISPPTAPIAMKIIRWYALHRRLSLCREGGGGKGEKEKGEGRKRGRGEKLEGKGNKKKEEREDTHTCTHARTQASKSPTQ